MRLNRATGVTIVYLSRRNLRTLIVQLDSPGHRAIATGMCFDEPGRPTGELLVVRSEPDQAHYAQRPAPGAMRQSTEQVLKAMDDPERWG